MMGVGVRSEHRFVSFDGTPIFFYRDLPTGISKGSILIIHGMGEHGGRYAEFADWLNEAGIAVYRIDLRGFGQSGGKRGFVESWFDYFRDLEGLLSFITRDQGGKNIFLLGHSFGGLLAASWMSSGFAKKIRGLVLTSPLLGVAMKASGWEKIFGRAASVFWPSWSASNQVDLEVLTHDPVIAAARLQDSLAHNRITARLFTEMELTMQRQDQIAALLTTPTLVLQAGDDRIVSREATLSFFSKLNSVDKEIFVYEDCFHELLQETRRVEIYTKILNWIFARLI